jgi:glycosyltransferase involved in cell wall biosynthesis
MENPPFQHEVHAFTAVNPDDTLVSEPNAYFGDGDELWGDRRNKAEYLLNVPRVYNDLQESDFDILHILQLSAIVYPTGILNSDTPVVIGPDVAGWSPVRSGGQWEVSFPESLKPKGSYWLKRFLTSFGAYDAATVYGKYHRNILIDMSVPAAKSSIIPAGVDPIFSLDSSPAETDNGTPHLLYVGDLSEHKGLPVLIEALKLLQQEVTVTVLGAGDPDTFPTDEFSNVTVEGFVDRSDLPEYYKSADLHVMPSIDETAGTNTVIESLACGTPVVVTDKLGINEFPPSDASVMFWPREPEPLAAAIETALRELPQLTAAARSHAAEFHVDRTLNYLDNFYREHLTETN